MKRLLLITLLIGLAVSAPTSKDSGSSESKEDDKVVITSKFFPKEFLKHTAEHEVVQILVPLNALNFNEDESSEESKEQDENKSTVFFVEADIVDGVKEYKGVSVIHNGQVKKLVETGTDVAADNEQTKTAYIAATDGLYKYNDKENSAEKYGSITDSLIGIVKVNGSDIIYVLTKDNEVYKVTEKGTKKEKIDDVVGAKQIVLDYSNNLYYYGADKQPYVVSKDGVKKIEGLPASPTEITLLKPPFVIDDGVPVILDNKAYIIYANGSNEVTDFEFEVKPSAYSMEATLVQYFAYDKKIYEYNILAIILSELLEELRNFLNNSVNEIRSIATKTRSELVVAN